MDNLENLTNMFAEFFRRLKYTRTASKHSVSAYYPKISIILQKIKKSPLHF